MCVPSPMCVPLPRIKIKKKFLAFFQYFYHYLFQLFLMFLVATKRLYKRVCPSVRPSVGPSVRDAFAFRPSRSDIWPCIRACYHFCYIYQIFFFLSEIYCWSIVLNKIFLCFFILFFFIHYINYFINFIIFFVRDGIHSVADYNSTRVGVVVVVVVLLFCNRITCYHAIMLSC